MRTGLGKFLTTAVTLCLASVLFALAPGKANAATATFLSPAEISDADLAAISTSGDNTGFLVGLNQIFSFLIDPPLSPTSNTSISIFTLAPDSGSAHATIRFGSYNNGSPTFVASKNVKAGHNLNLGNLFQTGCGPLGGCDYVEIITNKTNKGAEGVEVDYVEVDGQVVEVVSPTPEPSTWAMMIMGFIIIAARLKHLKNGPPNPAASYFAPTISRC